MLTKLKGLQWKELRELMSDSIGFVTNYIEFIMSINPALKNKKTITELRSLEKRLAKSTGPFLTYEDTIRLQEMIHPLIIEWNPDIENQVRNFYNAHVEIARATGKSERLRTSYNPFKLLQNNFDRFMLAKTVAENIFNNIDLRKPSYIEVYAMCYSIIVATETVEHYVFKQFKKSLKLFGLEKKYDIHDIFSIIGKMKNRKGQYEADLRVIRNALSHFNFKANKKGKQNIMTLVLDSGSSNPRKLTFEEFKIYYFNSIFLLQSFLSIQYWIMAFATIRAHFVKRRICPNCRKGFLQVSYKKEIYETREGPDLYTFWVCDKCKKTFPYKSHKSKSN